METIRDILLDVTEEGGQYSIRLFKPPGEQPVAEERWPCAPRAVLGIPPPPALPDTIQYGLIGLRQDLRRLWIHGPDEAAAQGWERLVIPGMPGRVVGRPLGLDEDLQVLRWASGVERWPPVERLPRGDRLGVLVLSCPRHCDHGGTPIPGVKDAVERALAALSILEQQRRAAVFHVPLDRMSLERGLERFQDPVHLLIYIGHSTTARIDGELEVSISLSAERRRVVGLRQVLGDIGRARGTAVRAVLLDSCSGGDAWKLTDRRPRGADDWAPLATCGLDGEIGGPPMAALAEGFCQALVSGLPWAEACAAGLRAALEAQTEPPREEDFSTVCVGLAVAEGRLVPTAGEVKVHGYWRSVVNDQTRGVGLPDECSYVPLAICDRFEPPGTMTPAEALERHRSDPPQPHSMDLSLSRIFSADDSHVVAVVGEPGCGKTTLLEHIWKQNSLAALGNAPEPAVPSPPGAEVEVAVYLHLARDVAARGQVAAALAAREGLGWLLDQRQRGFRCLLLLDALDEVPTGSRQRLFDDLLSWLQQPLQRERVRCILTSRTAGFPGWSYPVRTLRLLDQETLARFVEAHNARDVLRRVSGVPRLERLMRWPRFAARICETYRRAPEKLEGGLLEVQQEHLDDLLRSRAFGDPKQRRKTVFGPLVKQEVLERLAWDLHLHRGDPSLWDRPGLVTLLENIWDGRFSAEILPAGTRQRLQRELRGGLGRQLFDELSLCAGLLVPVGRDLDDVHDFVDRSWWGCLAAMHALRKMEQGGAAPDLDQLVALGFHRQQHRFDADHEDLLLFFAEGQQGPAFLDALWRVNKTMALRCYEISCNAARRGSIIDLLLTLEEQQQLYPRLCWLRQSWGQLDLQSVSQRVVVTEALVRDQLLAPPDEDGVVREDGAVLCWIQSLLEMLSPGHSWAARLHDELFNQALRADRMSWAVVNDGIHHLGHAADPDNPGRCVQLSAHAVGPLVTCREYERLDPLHQRAPGQGGDDPVVNVTWYEAGVFAARMGCQLPTEAQWEADARGGIHDDTGRVGEWCRDWFDSGYLVETGDCEDPEGPARGSGRVVRGKRWDHRHVHRSAAGRSNAAPFTRDRGIGFRCCRRLEGEG